MRVHTAPSRILSCLLAIGLLTASSAQALTPTSPLDQPISTSTPIDRVLNDESFIGTFVLAVQQTPGYAGEWFDEATRTLTIYWQGTVPDSLRTQANSEAPRGLTVTWRPGKYSERELSDLASDLWASDLEIESIEYASDGSGITVGYVTSPTSRGVTPSETLKKSTTARASELSSAITWSPVASGEVESADTRKTDTSPFDGGSRITSGSGGCSAGYAAQRDSTGTVGMLTAWHCSDGVNDVTWKVSGSNVVLGKTTSVKSKGWDVQFIKGTGDFTNSIFYGASDTGSKKSFATGMLYFSAPHPIGSTVTVSGGYSGNQSGKIVAMVELNYLGSAQNGNKYYKVEATGDNPLGGNGDSGSPTVEVLSNGKLIPVGLYVAFSSSSIRPCKGVPESSTRECSKIGYISPWYKIVDALGVS